VESGPLANSSAPYRILNLGNGKPVKLLDFIENLEKQLGKKAIKIFKPMQNGDIYQTYAQVDDLFKLCSYQPKVDVEQGIAHFVHWYKQYTGS
jgi:UDP-glucuronate 4-epimerase